MADATAGRNIDEVTLRALGCVNGWYQTAPGPIHNITFYYVIFL